MNELARPTDFAAILMGMPQPYLVLDTDLVIVGASDAYLSLTERTRDDIVGRSILEAFPENPDAAGTVEQGPLEISLRHALATGKPHEMAVIQYDIPQPGGGFTQKFWTPIHTPVARQDGTIRYIIQNPMDVTESVVKRREADARLRVALHAADLASWEYEPETDMWRRSHAVDVMFGFYPGEGGPVAKPYFARMHPDDLGRVQQVVASVLDSPDQTAMNFDYRIMLPDGKVRHINSRGEVLRTSSGKVRMIGVMMDMTAERDREAELSMALKAQEQLLSEVNHRVKNSLQLVVSTLRLQARRLENPVVLQAFDEAISRVRAIISVHERLYRTQNSLTVDMSDHITKLCLDIAGSTKARRIEVTADEISLPTERAIPISVILNELLSSPMRNALKEGAAVHVSLREIAGGLMELEVSDAAQGTLSDLSLKLVNSMASQIDGTFRQLEGAIYNATVTFPKERD
ncbi:histidine kinase dimerization/phosphoacceptor domain -containing protein [Neorhizobium sp. BT27B]|uniref:sensor histidine kinase n=1 Tax=Neorhizobium sp. BT27B TaxID=3142625 RepID=UPI003D2C8331